MRIQRSGPSGRRNPFLKALLIFVLLTGASFCAALAWQTAEEKSSPPEESPIPALTADSALKSDNPLPLPQQSGEPSASLQDVPSDPPSGPPESQPPASSEAEEPEEPESARSSFGTPSSVPESGEVESAYFDDALFIGDSISTGIPLYHIADNAAVVAFTGINTESINTREVIETPEGRITMLEAANATAPRGKVYIMLGGNGIDFDKETFIKGYRAFVLSIKEAFPDAVIYLQSMTPVTKNVQETYNNPNLNNERIREYNDAVAELAGSLQVHYLNIYEALADDEGYLPPEASPVDGMHFTPEYYAKWFRYLRTHTVEAKK